MKPLRIAVANGNLSAAIMSILAQVDLHPKFKGRSLTAECDRDDQSYWCIKTAPADVPEMVYWGACHIGFTGKDWYLASGLNLIVVREWNVAAKTNQPATLWLVKRKNHNPPGLPRVAAEHQWFAGLAMNKLGVHQDNYLWRWSQRTTESLLLTDPPLADYAVVVVETGETLTAHGNMIEKVCEILVSPLVMLTHPNRPIHSDLVRQIAAK